MPLQDLPNDDLENIIIFDNYMCDKSQQDTITEYFTGGRHKNCSVFYLSRSFYETPKTVKQNCSHFILFKVRSRREVQLISISSSMRR